MRGKKLLFYLPLSLLTTNGPEEVVLHVFFIFCISHLIIILMSKYLIQRQHKGCNNDNQFG